MFQEQIGFPRRRISIRLGLLIGEAVLPAFDFAFQNRKAKGVRNGDSERAAGKQEPGERADGALEILSVHEGLKTDDEVKAHLLELWKSLQGLKAALGKNEIRAGRVPGPLLGEAAAGVDTENGCGAALGKEARLIARSAADVKNMLAVEVSGLP